MLDDLTTALLDSINLQDRVEAALSFFVPRLADGGSIVLDQDPAQVRAFSRGALTAPDAVTLPLQYKDGRLGHVQLRLNERGSAVPREVLDALVRRAACGLRHALAFEREQRASFAFQYAALTTELPKVDGYRIDAVYEAGRTEALIGGDWYDAFVLTDGRLILSIGDVVGSGLRAAVAMVNVRQSLRTVAQIHADPALMLEAANRTLAEEFPDRFVTTFVALIDPITRTCAYASAGHPPPFLRYQDGDVIQLPTGGVPLGVPSFSKHVRVNHLMLEPGTLLVLYTDGVTEAQRRPLEGERRLRDAVSSIDPKEAAPAKALYASLLGDGARDDVALVTVSVEQHREIPRWRFDPRWADVTRRARSEISRTLAKCGLDEERLLAFNVVFAELVANVIRHARGTAEFLLQDQHDSCVLHVLDKGPGFQFSPRLPNDLFSESGRGLYLMSRLADGLSVDRRPGGGSHARITLLKSKGAHT